MPHLLTHMPHFLPKHTDREVGPAESATASDQDTATPVGVGEQRVIFGTAAEVVPPPTPHRHWPQAIAGAVGHIPHHLPPPQPHPWRDDAIHTYFETTRMSRQMEHL
jgi:hypothetical protein